MFYAMVQKLPMLLKIQLLFYLLYLVWIKQQLKRQKKNTVTLHIPYINFMHRAITAVDIMIKHLAQFKVALTEALFFAFVKYI